MYRGRGIPASCTQPPHRPFPSGGPRSRLLRADQRSRCRRERLSPRWPSPPGRESVRRRRTRPRSHGPQQPGQTAQGVRAERRSPRTGTPAASSNDRSGGGWDYEPRPGRPSASMESILQGIPAAEDGEQASSRRVCVGRVFWEGNDRAIRDFRGAGGFDEQASNTSWLRGSGDRCRRGVSESSMGGGDTRRHGTEKSRERNAHRHWRAHLPGAAQFSGRSRNGSPGRRPMVWRWTPRATCT